MKPPKAAALILVALVAVSAQLVLSARDAPAANPIKLFAPWDAGQKWDTIFGYYFNPNPGPGRHDGIDFNGVYDINDTRITWDDAGYPVRASQDGMVVFSGNAFDGYGYRIDIDHGGGALTRYAHLQQGSVVGNGTRVLHGQLIGKNGSTGLPPGNDHIHFEVRVNGTPQLPTPFDGATMAQGALFLSHNFVERLEIGYRASYFNPGSYPDIGAYSPAVGNWYVALNAGTNWFSQQPVWLTNWARDAIPGNWRHLAGDFDGDGDTDIAGYYKTLGRWAVARNTGTSFSDAGTWLDGWAVESALHQWRPFTGDFTGDGKDDIGVYHPVLGRWFVARSTGSSFVPLKGPYSSDAWLDEWAQEGQNSYWQNSVGDFNYDGKDDILGYHPRTGSWYVALSTGSAFADQEAAWISDWAAEGTSPGTWVGLVGRFAGDARTDIGAYHPSLGRWYVARNTGSSFLNAPGPYLNTDAWIVNWAVEDPASDPRWRPFVGPFYGASSTDDIGAYSARLGRWFIANNGGYFFAPVDGPFAGNGAWLDDWADERDSPGAWRTY